MTIVFEGLPGSGKTTLVNHFARIFEAEVVPEIIDLGESWKRACATNDQSFFWQNDLQKSLIAAQAPKHAFLDRGYVTTLAYNYSGWIFNQESDFPKLLNNYFTDIVPKNLQPDAYLLFSMSTKLSNERKKRETIKGHPMQDEDFLKKIHFFYQSFLSTFEPDIPVYHVDANASLETVQENVKHILTRILQAHGNS